MLCLEQIEYIRERITPDQLEEVLKLPDVCQFAYLKPLLSYNSYHYVKRFDYQKDYAKKWYKENLDKHREKVRNFHRKVNGVDLERPVRKWERRVKQKPIEIQNRKVLVTFD